MMGGQLEDKTAMRATKTFSGPMRALLALTLGYVGLLPLTASAQRAGGPPPPPVKVATAQMAVLAPNLSVPGTVVSRNDAQLAAEVSGKINWIAEIGSRIEKGKPVATIEDAIYRLQESEYSGVLERERNRVAFLDREVNRLRQLAAENITAKNKLDETETDLAEARNEVIVAESRLRQTQIQRSRARIEAPFSGIVTERIVNLGEHIQVGESVVRLVDPDDLEVVARAPLSSIRYINEGDSLPVHSQQFSGDAEIRTIVPFRDGRSHLFELRLRLATDEWRVGESVRLDVPSAEPIEVLAVPRDALVLRREGSSVFRIGEDNMAERLTVTTGLGAGQMIQITSGLSVGDRVVVRGAERLRPGQQVTVMVDDGGRTAQRAGSP
jgi:RND family efflux transporter MFP subunit